ncbi:MAG: response regulator transcription factor [Bacteroidia bacterium]
MKIALAVVDDQILFRQGIVSLLKDYVELEVIIEAENGSDLINSLKRAVKKPDVVLLDLEMPVMCGVQTTEYLRKHYPEIKILIISHYNDELLIRNLLERGAHEFLLKDFSIETVAKVIYEVMKPDYFKKGSISKEVFEGLTKPKIIKPVMNPDNLSKRELEIIRFLSMELTSKEISEKLFISPKTVGCHRENIMKKIGALNTIGIVVYAMKNNLF